MGWKERNKMNDLTSICDAIKKLDWTYPLCPIVNQPDHPDVDYLLYLLSKTLETLHEIANIVDTPLSASMPPVELNK